MAGHRITVSYDDGLDSYGNHEAAAKALQKKLGWKGRLVGGGLPDGKGYAFVFGCACRR